MGRRRLFNERYTREEIRTQLAELDQQAAALERQIRHAHCCGGVRTPLLVWQWRMLQDRMIALEESRPLRRGAS